MTSLVTEILRAAKKREVLVRSIVYDNEKVDFVTDELKEKTLIELITETGYFDSIAITRNKCARGAVEVSAMYAGAI